MMGNETSQLTGLEIDEKAVEVTDFWTHHSAVMHSDNVTPLSVFIGEPLVGGALWINQTPLEKATKNLMLHRHPCILKYISSWNKGSKLYLAVEYVKPLAHVIGNQTTLQICIGLHSILKAILFLHDKALASHNNICSACVYVTQDGSWKLGGLEYLCRFQDLNYDYLMKTRAHRYEKAIDPDEDKNSKNEAYFKNGAIDKYAFALLVDEVLRKKGNIAQKILCTPRPRNVFGVLRMLSASAIASAVKFILRYTKQSFLVLGEVPCLEEFRTFCKTQLQHKNLSERPSWYLVLQHEFFTHNFIVIYSFLTELPLKSENEKEEFFTSLAIKLRSFPEDIVARQLGELLLSRLVLLDRTAQNLLLPYILVPKQESVEDDHIFSESTFKLIIIPKLLHIFRVRDAQIRLLLLSHFKKFVALFTKEQLQNYILPELLIGIKDTNDHLVSITLIALSDLVPILGAATVIGGKRARLFNDGRPAAYSSKKSIKRNSRRSSLLQEQNHELDVDSTSVNSPVLYLNQMLQLPERPSPDGGEEEISTTEIDQSAEDDLENWSDWDANESNQNNVQVVDNVLISSEERNSAPLQQQNSLEVNNVSDIEPVTVYSSQNILSLTSSVPNGHQVNKTLPDISELDIKNQKNNSREKNDDFDFFQDMEPVIEMTNIIVISEKEVKDEKQASHLNVSMISENHEEEGWGDDLDWVEN